MGWFQTVSDAVYDALCAVFNADPVAQTSLDRFIPAYVGGVNTPQEDRDVDVCYFALSIEQGTTEDYVMIENKQDQVIVTKTIPVAVLLTFYGPNSDDDAEKFWSRYLVDQGYGSARSILRAQKITPRGMPQRPISIPEPEGSIWRRRCDVRLPLNYLETETISARTVAEVPDVNINIGG